MRETLTAKQQRFVELITDISNKACFGNATESARQTGYKGKDNYLAVQGNRLIRNDKIKQAIDAIIAERAKKIDVTVEFIVQALLDGLAMARSKRDLSAMARFSELLGKYKAMFTDNINQHIDEQQAIEQTEQAEAKRIAAIRLRETA